MAHGERRRRVGKDGTRRAGAGAGGTGGIGATGNPRRDPAADDASANPETAARGEAVRTLWDSHGEFARALVAAEMRRRDGRHRSITPSEFGRDIVLEAAGLNLAGQPRTTQAPLAADDPRVRPRIWRRVRWRLDVRERLIRVRARRNSVDVHELRDAVDAAAIDPLERLVVDEAATRATWIRDHRRSELGGTTGAAVMAAEANGSETDAGAGATGAAADANASDAPATPANRASCSDLLHDEADPDVAARLHAFARREADGDPKAARQLALHLLVEVLGVPMATARTAVGATRSTAYRDLEAIKDALAVPPRE